MAHTYTNFIYHLVWSTKNRIPYIKKEYKPRLNSYIRTVIENEGAKLLFINGIEDHIHLLVAVPATLLIPDLIEKVKPISTKWFRKTFPNSLDFSWQEGYGGFTVARSILPNVIKYLENQEEHHKKVSFQDEFKKFLDEQGILYNIQHLYD